MPSAWSVVGAASDDAFGASLSDACDLDGDGYDDVAVGVPEYALNRGRVYVYPGGPTGLAAVPSVTLEGDGGLMQLGCAVACAGDVDGDGYDDLVVGADGIRVDEPSSSTTRPGRVLVYRGSAVGLDITVSWMVADGSTTAGYDALGDADGDGSLTEADCNDAEATIHPGAVEVCEDPNLDEDCDSLADDRDPDVTGTTARRLDEDGDGYGAGRVRRSCEAPTAWVSGSPDCDDADASIHPGASDVLGDGIDADCNGTDGRRAGGGP